MRKMSSLRLYAPPCCDCASSSSLASRCAIDFSRRLRANSTSQRTASVRARRAGTSTGTWYVAPPTRRERTSSTGVSALIETSSASTGSLPVRSLRIASASYTIRSAVDFLPSSITRLMTWVTSLERWTGSGSTGRFVAAAHEHDGVLLQVVALARDVRRDLHRVGEAHAGDLAQSRVRLLRRGRVHARAHAAPLRSGHALLAALAGLQARRGQLLRLRVPALADQLGSRRHTARDGSSGAD